MSDTDEEIIEFQNQQRILTSLQYKKSTPNIPTFPSLQNTQDHSFSSDSGNLLESNQNYEKIEKNTKMSLNSSANILNLNESLTGSTENLTESISTTSLRKRRISDPIATVCLYSY